MKPIFFLIAIGFNFIVNAQTNYTGRYGSIESRKDLLKRYPGISVGENGYKNSLILLRLGINQYKFWLDVDKGFPSYNSGSIEGVIIVRKDSAVFKLKYSFEDDSCRMIFHFQNEKIFITTDNSHCGFGHGVSANGLYPRINSKIPTTKDIATIGQFEPTPYKVILDKAVIYKDENLQESNNQYFIKGDIIYAFKENKGFIFTQFITKSGKYVEGWLKQSDLEYHSLYH